MHLVYFDYPFVRLPRALNSEPVFLNLSVEARYLLTMLLDRLELSYNNADKFTDEEGKVYAICTIEEICEKFNCSSTKTLRMLKELECNGFIIRKRENRTVPCRIYITDLTFEFINCKLTTLQNQDSTSDFTKCKPASLQNQDSRVHENESRDFTKCEDIYTYNNNNNIINNNSSIIVTDDEIKEQIEFEYIYCEKNAAMVDEIIMIISDIYNGRTPTVKIGKEELPRELVISRFRRLDGTHISNIIWYLERNKTKIRNMKSYLITLLYDEVTTSDCAVVADFAMHYGAD